MHAEQGTSERSWSWSDRPARLGIHIARELMIRIVSGENPVGTLLPNEAALCETFGVSRTVIREAVKMVEQKGLIRVRQGEGTTVNQREDWNLLDPLVLELVIDHDSNADMLDDVVGVRRLLEEEMARRAATRLVEQDRADLSAYLDIMDREGQFTDAFAQADFDFHEKLMRISGNLIGVSVVHLLHEEARRSLRYRGHPSPADCVQSNREHRDVFEALVGGDGDGAASAMGKHIHNQWVHRRDT